MLRELRPSQRLPGGTFGTTRQNPLALVLIAGLAILLAVLYGYWRRTVRAKRPGSGRLNAITPQLGVVVAVAAIGFQLVGGTALAAPSVKSVTTATIPSSHGYDVGIRPATFRDSMAPHALAPRREERLQAVAASAASGVAAEDGAGGLGRLARARMDRTLNPDRGGSLGGFSGNTTAHGAIRIGEAGFDDIDVAIIRAGSKYEQADGAFAYVAQAGKDSYNLIIQNVDGAIVTAHRGWPLSDVAGMARSNGWSGW